jgi:hypothetical protein
LKPSDRAREQRLKKFFNLTSELWDVIAAFQNHVCFVCGRTQKSGKRLATDHAHAGNRAGLVRGLLCASCNRALGKMERTWPAGTDVAKMLIRLAEFITDPPAVKALGREIFTFPGRFGTKRHRKWLQNQKK